MNFRQVHLDFHTSGLIPNVGGNFDKEQFKTALTVGHVNSITLFAKCHHGWAYYPSKVNEMNEGLNGFDLLGAQLEACKEIGVNAPVYLSAGFDEKEAVRHPEWQLFNKDGTTAGGGFANKATWHLLCYNTAYLEHLLSEIEEVMQMYNPSGIFLDIYCSDMLLYKLPCENA